MNYQDNAVIKGNCCGCGACADVCPKSAINMIEDEEGFLYPQIERSKCMKCEICNKVCVFDSNYCNLSPIYDLDFKTPIVYGCINKSEPIRASSRSGGVFTAVSDWILAHGGVIYGCEMDNGFQIRHNRAVAKEGRDKFKKSKYTQSKMTGIYELLKKDLQSGVYVLFSGTSCQTAAIRNYGINIYHISRRNIKVQ